MTGERFLEGRVGIRVAQQGDVDRAAAQGTDGCAHREHARHERVVSAPWDERERTGHAPVPVRADRYDCVRPCTPDGCGAPSDMGERADEEGIEAGGVKEDPLRLFGDRGAHVVGKGASSGARILGQRGDFGEGTDGDGGGQRGDDGGDFESQVEAGVGLGDAADRAIAPT